MLIFAADRAIRGRADNNCSCVHQHDKGAKHLTRLCNSKRISNSCQFYESVYLLKKTLQEKQSKIIRFKDFTPYIYYPLI